VNAGLQVIGVVGSKDIEYVKALGSQTVVNYQSSKFQNAVRPVDLVLDTVGGETREWGLRVQHFDTVEEVLRALEEAVRLVKCKTVDLEVPADAELVQSTESPAEIGTPCAAISVATGPGCVKSHTDAMILFLNRRAGATDVGLCGRD
jgi:hypothetical protein